MTHRYTKGIGTRLQGGTPVTADMATLDPRGLLLRGVVVATYVTDDPKVPVVEGDRAIGVYCDVLVYSSMPQVRYHYMRVVPVSQDRSGMHSGRIWKPRAATLDVSGGTLDVEKATDPAAMDGDHVLIGFLDRNYARPIILRALPHPACDAGNDGNATGHRLRLELADGDPDFFRHHGSHYGIEDTGNWVCDTTMANTGTLAADGTEPAPPTDGTGAQVHLAPKDAKHQLALVDMSNPSSPVVETVLTMLVDSLELALHQGDNLKLEGKDADAKLTLGNGAKSMAIAERLATLWGNLKTTLETWVSAVVGPHVHPTAWGPSGPSPTLPGSLTVPAWDSTIESTHVKTPDL